MRIKKNKAIVVHFDGDTLVGVYASNPDFQFSIIKTGKNGFVYTKENETVSLSNDVVKARHELQTAVMAHKMFAVD